MVVKDPIIKLAAIDNGLAFPLKHPDSWRACKHLVVIVFNQSLLTHGRVMHLNNLSVSSEVKAILILT